MRASIPFSAALALGLGAALFPFAVSAAPAFDVDLTADKATARAGETVSYELRVTNETKTLRMQTVQVTIPQDAALPELPAGATARSGGFQWAGLSFGPEEEMVFEFTLRLPERLRSANPVRVTASAGGVTASAVTTPPTVSSALSLSITDGKAAVSPGELLTYRIVVMNDGSRAVTEHALQAAIPTYAEFVDATEGGYWNGKSVLWQGLAVAPRDERSVTMTVRVRSDAPAGKTLLASAAMNGARAVDETAARGGSRAGDEEDQDADTDGDDASSATSSSGSSGPSVPATTPQASGSVDDDDDGDAIPATTAPGSHGGLGGGSISGWGAGTIGGTYGGSLSHTGAPMAALAAWAAFPLSAVALSARRARRLV